MSQAGKSVVADRGFSRFIDSSDPQETLDNCISSVDFLGSAIDSMQHNGQEIDGDAVVLLCHSIADALWDVKAKIAKGGAQ